MSAVERIELSRARLRHALMPPALPVSAAPTGNLSWLRRIEDLPAVGLVVDAVSAWWSQHPLRAVALVARDASNEVIKPIALRNPLALLVVAGLVGAALAWSRPWRWALKPALFAGLLPQLVSRVIPNLPLQSWLAILRSTISGGAAFPAGADRVKPGPPPTAAA